MSEPSKNSPSLQPRWFIRSFWAVQRAACSVTGGRFGLRAARADRWGMMRLWTRWAVYDKDLDAFAARRSRETAVVILSPRPE